MAPVDTSNPTVLEATAVCVVGGGPVGVAVALDLADRGIDVTIVEAGADHAVGRSDLAASISQTGMRFPHSLADSMMKGVGGTAGAWMERIFRARPLEDEDFVARPDGQRGGWPITADDLGRFLPAAHELLGLGPVEFEAEAFRSADEVLIADDDFETTVLQLPDLARFRQHLERARRHPRITWILDAEVLSLAEDEDGTITAVRAVAPDRTVIEVAAKDYVLACGGFGAPRILLASTDRSPAGIGNHHDLVGRFFMEHPHIQLGIVRAPSALAARLAFYGRVDRGSTWTEGYVLITPEAQLEHGLPAAGLWLHPASARQTLRDAGEPLADIRDTALRRDLWPRARRLAHVTARAATRRQPLAPYYDVWLQVEQFPHPESRVRLTGGTDELGRPDLELHWHAGHELVDLRRRFREFVEPRLVRHGLSPIESLVDDDELYGVGNHFMGTTRMGRDATEGVVDGEGRVFGTPNLFVVGCPVFSTGGAINPTLAAVTLGFRLADELQRRALPTAV